MIHLALSLNKKKSNILLKRFKEVTGVDKTPNQIYNKTLSILKKENCEYRPFKKLLKPTKSQENIKSTSSIKKSSPAKEDLIQSKLDICSLAFSKGYTKGAEVFNEMLDLNPGIIPCIKTLDFNLPETYNYHIEQQIHYLGYLCAFQRLHEAYLNKTTVSILYPFESENSFNITPKIYSNILKEAKRVCASDLNNPDTSPIIPLLFENLHQEAFKEAINMQIYKLFMNNAIHRANLKIMKRSTQSSVHTTSNNLNQSPSQMSDHMKQIIDRQKKQTPKPCQTSYYQEKKDSEIILSTSLEEEIDDVLSLF